MAFTYSGDPGASNSDNLRFTVGDTDKSDAQFNDQEIAFLLSSNNNSVKSASIVAVRRLIAKFSREVTKAVGDLRLNLSDRVKHYRELLSELKRDAALSSSAPIAGGISRSRKNTVKEDTDRVTPDFQKGQFDNHGAGNVSRLDSEELLR